MKRSEYIKSLIKSKGLTLKDISKKMNISISALSLKINGHRVFKVKEIDVLLKVLDMKYEEIFEPEKVDIVDDDKVLVVVGNFKTFVSQPTASEIVIEVREKMKKSKEVI